MFVPVSLGEKVKSVAIERYRAVEGQKDIGCILTRNIGAVNMHFSPNTGFFYCFRGECCESLGLPSQRYILPWLKYTLEDLKSRKYGMPIFIQYLPLGRDAYEGIMVKEEIHQDITKFDMVVTCEDAQYQKNKFDVIGPAKWREDKDMQQIVKELYADYKSLIEMSIARTLTAEAMTALLLAEGADKVPDRNQRKPNPRSQSISLHKAPALQNDSVEMGQDLGLDKAPVQKAPAAAPAKEVKAKDTAVVAEVLPEKEKATPVAGDGVSFDDLLK